MSLVCCCPSCATRLRVGEEQLTVANGQVRCGACLAVFDGRANLTTPAQPAAAVPTDSPPQHAEAPAAPSAGQPQAEEVPLPVSADDAAPPEPEQQPAAKPAVALGPRQAMAAAPKQRPPRGERPPPKLGYRGVAAAAAVAVLTLTLAATVLGLQYQSWSQQPALRGVYANACALVGCDLPPLRSLAGIGVERHSADARRGPPEQLTLSAVLVNRAPFAQRFPTLAVRMLAADGTILRRHRLAPAAYLGASRDERTSLSMAPNQRTPITLRLDDPGAAAVSYAIALW